MKSNNPLDLLFRDIKHELWVEEQKRLRAPKDPPKPQISTYANPLNWRMGKVIRLIHVTEGSLGDFQEYFHNLSPTARRLLPAAAGLEPSREELVFGEFWLHPKFQAPLEPDSEAEIRAVEARFLELMEDFEDDE